jgi:hypothetical protein
MLLLNGRLSRTAQLALVDRLKRVAREFSAQHIDDSALPLAERPPVSLLLACRPWTPALWRPFERGQTRASGRVVRR